MSKDLIDKILEEIGLEPINSECKEEKGEGSCVQKPVQTYQGENGLYK